MLKKYIVKPFFLCVLSAPPNGGSTYDSTCDTEQFGCALHQRSRPSGEEQPIERISCFETYCKFTFVFCLLLRFFLIARFSVDRRAVVLGGDGDDALSSMSIMIKGYDEKYIISNYI